MKGDRLYLVNIAESIELIEVYTRDGREAFSRHAWRRMPSSATWKSSARRQNG